MRPCCTNPIGLHLLGALSLAGWAVLAVVSRQSSAPLQLLFYLGVHASCWILFVLAGRSCRGSQGKHPLGALLVWSLAFRVAGFFAAPLMEDDYFRFLWDGRQFALTGNPYASAPAAYFSDETVPERFREILDQINYPHVPTIYGPACQLGFALSYWIAPAYLWPWKLMVIGADLVALALVFRGAERSEFNARESTTSAANFGLPLLIFGWCPLAIFETSFNAHPDILAIALLLAALVFRQKESPLACAIFCALAVAAKVFALLLVPFLLGRRARAWAVFALGLAACYLPFWWQGSLADWAGLSAFAAEWEFNSSFYALAKMLLGPSQGRLACGIAFAAFWCVLFVQWLVNRRDLQGSCLPPGTALFGGFLLLSSTVNPWYLLWLLPFTALRPTVTGPTALAAVSLSYVTGLNLGDTALANFEHPFWVRPIEYGAVALVGVVELWRRRSTGGTVRTAVSR